MVLFGLFAAVHGPSYGTGTLMHMGPGFMPTALGVVLVLLGIAISISAVGTADGEGEDILPEHPEWLGWLCILAGPFMFIVFGQFGFIPATFSCVFVSALGDRSATWTGAFVLAVAVTIFGVVVFPYLLQVPIALLKWG